MDPCRNADATSESERVMSSKLGFVQQRIRGEKYIFSKKREQKKSKEKKQFVLFFEIIRSFTKSITNGSC